MSLRAVYLAVDDVRIDHRTVVADDQVAQHMHHTGALIYFDHGCMSARGKSKLRSDQTVGAGNDVRIGVRESVIESLLQAALHAFGQEMLVVVDDAAELGEGDFLGR